MTQFQSSDLSMQARQGQSPDRWFAPAYWPIVVTLFLFTVIVLIDRALLPVVVSARAGVSPAVPLLIACSVVAVCVWPPRALAFSADRQQRAARTLIDRPQIPLFYRNARRTVPDVIRLPDASSDLRTTA